VRKVQLRVLCCILWTTCSTSISLLLSSSYSSCLSRALCVSTTDLDLWSVCPWRTLSIASAASRRDATCLKTFRPFSRPNVQNPSLQGTAVSGRLFLSSQPSPDVITWRRYFRNEANHAAHWLADNSRHLGVNCDRGDYGLYCQIRTTWMVRVGLRRWKNGHVMRDRLVSSSLRYRCCTFFFVTALKTWHVFSQNEVF
jgi:hypothetical protein